MNLLKIRSAYMLYSIYLIGTLVLTFIGSVVGTFFPINEGFLTLYGILSIGLSIALLLSKGKVKRILLAVFCFGEGAFIAPLFSLVSPTLLGDAILMTIIITIVAMMIGAKMKYSSKLGGILYTILFIGFFYTILCIFFLLPPLSILFVILFSAYIAYDISLFKEVVREHNGKLTTDEIINHVTKMYLNILNVFINILDFLNQS